MAGDGHRKDADSEVANIYQAPTVTTTSTQAERPSHMAQNTNASTALTDGADAPKHLQDKVNLFAACLDRCWTEWIRSVEPQPRSRNTGIRHVILQPSVTLANKSAQALAELATIADPENLNGEYLVAFEIPNRGNLLFQIIGHSLHLITACERKNRDVVILPRWAREMVQEATEWEISRIATHGGQLHRNFAIGGAHRVTSTAEIEDANTLWRPETKGVYKRFGNALNAVKRLG